jgi:hypothetical protein
MTDHRLVLALDLEGTLVSNAVSQIPRPGLWRFLEFCRRAFTRVVLYTAVSEDRARAVLRSLVQAGDAPPWFEAVEYVDWSGAFKDVSFVTGTQPGEVVLVDDQEAYVHPEQRRQWVPIEEFAWPYPETDTALETLQGELEARLRESRSRDP